MGQNEIANPQLSLSENVVMILAEPDLNKVGNITTDVYFTSVKTAEILKVKIQLWWVQ